MRATTRPSATLKTGPSTTLAKSEALTRTVPERGQPRAETPAPAKRKPRKTGPTSKSGDLVPVWVDVDTAKFLLRALTSALNQNIQAKKKGKN